MRAQGAGPHRAEAKRRFLLSEAIEPYKDDGKAANVSTISSATSDGKPHHQTAFCQSFFPTPEDAEQEQLLKGRIGIRMQELIRGSQ